ncbi:MAG: hypothetical protein ACLR44_04555 [Clostridia bacterium]
MQENKQLIKERKRKMTLISTIMLIMFLILLAWTWNSLGTIEKKTKIILITCGILAVYILTLIIFSISKIGITYENKEAMKTIQNVFVILFSIMNGYVILPFIFKKLEQINNDEIEKEKITKSIIFLVATIIFIFVFETSYFGNIQNNILTMINR